LTRRIIATGLAGAALYAATLGASATAQDAAPSGTPNATPVATSSAAPAPAAAPTQASTPASTPAQSSTPAATTSPAATSTASPSPFPSPVQTTVASPSATATDTPAGTPSATPSATGTPDSTATPGASPTATPGSTTGKGSHAHAHGNVQDGGKASTKPCTGTYAAEVITSTSTSTRDCAPARTTEEPTPVIPTAPIKNSDGSPAVTNPGFTLATPGPAHIGVPNFFIDKFRIPPFLLPIYQAAGMQYGIRWEVLAAINEIETDYGRNLNISSAGAVGWMQFMPSTWKMYGVDANGDGVKDPFNPVDAIFAAARYLRAAGGDTDLRRAIFAYNHAGWYVDSVLMRAQVIGGLPTDLVGSLTGLTQGRFPIVARATYAGALKHNGKRVQRGNAAMVVESDAARKGIDIYSRDNAPVIAVNDGKVLKIGQSKRLGRFMVVQDVYGNTYTYGGLGSVSKTYPVPKKRTVRKNEIVNTLRAGAKKDHQPLVPASTTTRAGAKENEADAAKPTKNAKAGKPRAHVSAQPAAPEKVAAVKERLFAHPNRPNSRAAGGAAQLGEATTTTPATRGPIGFDPKDFDQRKLEVGAHLIGGTIIGRLGKHTKTTKAHLHFEIRPAGRGAPRIDPKPILDGWKLLESTAIYRAADRNPFWGTDAENPSIGQILLMSKEELIKRVLADDRVQIYACGRNDIATGQIDRRVLATLEYLADSGLKPTVTALKCGHSLMTVSGNISEHSTGTAVDIGAVNGIVISPATQGPGSITDITIQRLLNLQGTMKPHQIISLMTFKGADNTLAMADHYNHIHIGWRPLYGENKQASRQIDAVLRPTQWIKLISRLGSIDNPVVASKPSKYALKVKRPASAAAGD
jgi:hypothetical protein